MIRFISNTQNDYKGYFHKDHLVRLLDQAEEVIFCIGFMKQSGWRIIKDSLAVFLKQKAHKARFFVGTGEGVTDPEVIKGIYGIVKRTSNCELVLCTPEAGIFHSKVYMFRKGETVTIVTGSANLTQGGWLINDELSVLIETSVHSEEYKQLMYYFERLEMQYYRSDLGDYIQRYEDAVNDYRNANRTKAPFIFLAVPLLEGQVNLPMLRRYYELYPGSKDYVVPKEREMKYKNAKANLKRLASPTALSDRQFDDLFGALMGHKGYQKLWHSGSIHRASHMTYAYRDGFRDLVRFAERSIALPTGQAFQQAMYFLKDLKRRNRIKGIGENIVAEILMSFDPYKFANLNENPLKALRMAGCSFPAPERFTGENYKYFVDLLAIVRSDLGMATFLEIDSFFNYIYWD